MSDYYEPKYAVKIGFRENETIFFMSKKQSDGRVSEVRTMVTNREVATTIDPIGLIRQRLKSAEKLLDQAK